MPPVRSEPFSSSFDAKTSERETYKGVLGFCAMDALRLALLVFVPALTLWLPGIK